MEKSVRSHTPQSFTRRISNIQNNLHGNSESILPLMHTGLYICIFVLHIICIYSTVSLIVYLFEALVSIFAVPLKHLYYGEVSTGREPLCQSGFERRRL